MVAKVGRGLFSHESVETLGFGRICQKSLQNFGQAKNLTKKSKH